MPVPAHKISTYIYIKIYLGARHGGAVVKVLALHTQDPIWAPVLIPGIHLSPVAEMMKFLASDFNLVQTQLLLPFGE